MQNDGKNGCFYQWQEADASRQRRLLYLKEKQEQKQRAQRQSTAIVPYTHLPLRLHRGKATLLSVLRGDTTPQ